MQFKNFSQNRIQFYYAVTCIFVLSLIIVDNIFAQAPPPQPVPQDGIDQLDNHLNPIRSSRINSINDRITLLKKLLENDQQDHGLLDSSPALPDALPTPSVSESPDRGAPELPSLDSKGEETEAEAALSPPTQIQTPVSPIPGLTSTLNSFELGNSLFMTGNYAAAIKSYEDALKDKTNYNESWTKCMLGSCFRLNGDYPKAEAIFREISNDKKADPYVIEHARWFLTYVESRRKANAEFMAIESEINVAIERLGNEKS